MIDTTLIARWLHPLRQSIQQPPLRPRVPVYWQGHCIGSVATDWPQRIQAQACALAHGFGWVPCTLAGGGWSIEAAELTPALQALAAQTRFHGVCGPWRNELLDVGAEGGATLGAVERGSVRVLGIATQAVHLIATSPAGQMWVQQRAWNKPTYPGRWDTLMGGMVSAGDDVHAALARETWEEAGLLQTQLHDVRYGGVVEFACPSDEGGPGMGYMRERIHWYHAVCPEGTVPQPTDGEVAQFQCLSQAQLQQWALANQFTPEASLVLAAYWGW